MRGDYPAFPYVVDSESAAEVDRGITIRELLAGLAMVGTLAYPGELEAQHADLAKAAVEQADHLLKELAKTT